MTPTPTPAEQLLRMRAAGASNIEIAKATGLTLAQVSYFVRALNLPRRRAGRRPVGVSEEVRQRAHEAARMRSKGLSVAEIASRFKLSRQRVYDYLAMGA